MRVSTMIRINPGMSGGNGLMDRITDFARQVEARGFPGIWVGDSMGRGRPTLDSLQVLTALAAVTRRVELGIAVLQLPLRHPIELAHRVQTLRAMSNHRLVLGVGSGSTRDDFALLGCDYDHRFRTFKNDLDIMKRVWNGQPVNGGTLSTWPGATAGRRS
jgi:alkanesulfonate monooxygenase SsuD/methylene tetrahydromethanopterin reductase-like flavin-dependent oxidoreductase (luciferase family)